MRDNIFFLDKATSRELCTDPAGRAGDDHHTIVERPPAILVASYVLADAPLGVTLACAHRLRRGWLASGCG